MKLEKVDYSTDSKHGCVQACLRYKMEVVKKPADGGIEGIGPHSCCSYIVYTKNGEFDRIFGNSRIRVPYKWNGADVVTACVHGELTALWSLYADNPDGDVSITEMYIEMSPCEKCGAALKNILADTVTVYYSFDHPGQVDAWKAAATKLCSG